MKNKMLSLNELKIQSFVTDLNDEKEATVKGGRFTREGGGCVRQTLWHDYTCGTGCGPTEMSCGIPCGTDDVPTNYC